MNKEEIIARPYEEYYEMIKDMSKDNMIQGLYDLSKECIEKENHINQLETNRDEAIKYIENNKVTIMGAYGIPMTKVNELKTILKRGKE